MPFIHPFNYATGRVHPVVRWLSTWDDPFEPNKVYDAAIAIGIGTHPDGLHANGRSLANARAAMDLYAAGLVRHVFLVGGNPPDLGNTESMAMLRSLMELGYDLPGEAMEMDMTSRNTAQNAAEALKLMRKRNLKSAVILAEALHAGRVRRTFRKAWRGLGMETCVIRTFGDYGPSTGKYTTPVSFCLREWLVHKPASLLLGRS